MEQLPGLQIGLPSDQTNIKHKTEKKKRKEAKKRAIKEKEETMSIERGNIQVEFK